MGAIVVSQLYGTARLGAPPAIAVVAVIVAASLGAATGWICHRWRIQPLIVTLGIGRDQRGRRGRVDPGQAHRQRAHLPHQAHHRDRHDLRAADPAGRRHLGRRRDRRWRSSCTAPSPAASSTRPAPTRGRPASRGIDTKRVWVGVFAAQRRAVGPGRRVCSPASPAPTRRIGDPYLFSGLTAVIVGGTTFMGARGDYTHTVVGALILTVLTTILVGKGYDQADQQIIFGVLILLVVAGYGRDRRLRDRV